MRCATACSAAGCDTLVAGNIGVPVLEGYGLTEASPVTHANPLGEKRKVGTIGVPLPSTEAVIFDLTRRNKQVKQGQIGELAVRGPQVMLGYWKDPKATRDVLTEDLVVGASE